MTALAIALGPATLSRATESAEAFSFDWLKERARKLAERSFESPRGTIAKPWRALGYDQYRSISFRRNRAVWRDKALFNLQFFHAGFQYDHPVKMHLVANGRATSFDYDASAFDFGLVDTGELPTEGLGYAGLRVHYPLHSASYLDEMLVFLGASYFRVLGRDQQYGASARGIAVDTALGSGEEFPIFTELWIEKPEPESTLLVVHALLDSTSLTGAYRFMVQPSTATTVDITANLYTRKAIKKLGVAPLTSMFMFGENSVRRFGDYRPEVHDSDGLMIHSSSGEWIWRPLENRRALSISSYRTGTPRGFGLVQRDQSFASYQDLEASYQRRPSFWVQPVSDWGDGRVELVEIPTKKETNDNIVTYWVPAAEVSAGAELEFKYLLTAYRERAGYPPGGHGVSVRIGRARADGGGNEVPANARLFIVEFDGGDLRHVGADQPVQAIFTAHKAKLSPPIAVKNTQTGGWRAFFDVYPEGDEAVDLRGYMRLHGHALTETWSYLWTQP
ncbi:MAG: glucan biosynthesis protein [Gammaproteobacteria bacterium]